MDVNAYRAEVLCSFATGVDAYPLNLPSCHLNPSQCRLSVGCQNEMRTNVDNIWLTITRWTLGFDLEQKRAEWDMAGYLGATMKAFRTPPSIILCIKIEVPAFLCCQAHLNQSGQVDFGIAYARRLVKHGKTKCYFTRQLQNCSCAWLSLPFDLWYLLQVRLLITVCF